MQPMTFALTIPSALSLYSLGVHDLPLRLEVDGRVDGALPRPRQLAARRALGRRQRDDRLRRGRAQHALGRRALPPHGAAEHRASSIFGAIYYFIPELTRQELYERPDGEVARLADVRLRATSTRRSGCGRASRERRAASQCCPSRWDDPNRLAIPVRARARRSTQLLFVFNIVQTFRGAERAPARRRTWSDPALEAVLVLSVLLLVGIAGVTGWVIGRETAPPPAPAVTAAADPGREVFAEAGCASCHTLAAAGASGTVGPNLDEAHPDAATVAQVVRTGGGAMPAFGGRLDDRQIEQLASFVASSVEREARTRTPLGRGRRARARRASATRSSRARRARRRGAARPTRRRSPARAGRRTRPRRRRPSRRDGRRRCRRHASWSGQSEHQRERDRRHREAEQVPGAPEACRRFRARARRGRAHRRR